jgi:hypothetical protein
MSSSSSRALLLTGFAALVSGCSSEASASRTPREASLIKTAAFPHDEHVTRFGLKCKQCHHETDAKALVTPHAAYLTGNGVTCTACHHRAGEPRAAQGCSNCHRATISDAADETETLSAKVVIHQTCWRCHALVKGAAASRTCDGCHVGAGGKAAPPKPSSRPTAGDGPAAPSGGVRQ